MRAKISADGMNAIYLDIKAFLEGVEVPLSGVELSYGVNEVPQATINIPASAVVRDLPEICKLHVFFKDLIPDPQTGEARWRLLFDGELIGYGYNTNPSGASISISAIHAASYMSLMQIIGLDVSGLINNPTANSSIAGNATLVSTLGINRVDSTIIQALQKNKAKLKNVADIVYLLAKTTLTETKKSSVGAYFAKKLGNDAGGLKILKRIFGVSAEAEAVTKDELEIKQNVPSTAPQSDNSAPTGKSTAGNRDAGPVDTPADRRSTAGNRDLVNAKAGDSASAKFNEMLNASSRGGYRVDTKTVTAYSKGDGHTPGVIMSNGEHVHYGAVASNDYPNGTYIAIDGLIFVVKDKMMDAGKVDIYMDTIEAARAWGSQQKSIIVFDSPDAAKASGLPMSSDAATIGVYGSSGSNVYQGSDTPVVTVSVTGSIIDFASFITSLAFFKRMKELYDQSSTRSLHDFILDFITRFYHNITYVPTLPNSKAILVKPEALFVDPPHCNVIFPTMRTSGSTSRAFKKEPTRTMLVSNPVELIGGSSQTLTNLVTIVYMDYDANGNEVVSPLKTITGDNVKQPTTFISKFEEKNGIRVSQLSAGSDLFLFLQSGYASVSDQQPSGSSSSSGTGVKAAGTPTLPALDPNKMGDKAVLKGQEKVGTPYVLGSGGGETTDCSKFTLDTFNAIGINLGSRDAEEQYNGCVNGNLGSIVIPRGQSPNWDLCQPGDLVFFRTSRNWDEGRICPVTHVGIFAGKDPANGRPIMTHAGTSTGVINAYLDGNETWFKTWGGSDFGFTAVGRPSATPGGGGGGGNNPAAPAVVPKDFQQSRRVSTGSDGKKKVNYVMKLSTAALQGVAKTLENLAGYMLIRERYQSRAGGYSTVFNPYVVPSFPLYNIESADPSSLGVSGYITRVSHSLNPSGCSTSVSYSFGHIQTEAKPKVFPVVEEEYVSKIEETYTKLFDVEKSKTESIDAERKWYGEEPRTLTQTYERLWRPLTSIDEYLKDIADGATIVNEETAQRAMYIWFSGSFFDVKTQDVIKKYTESILAGRAITLTDIS